MSKYLPEKADRKKLHENRLGARERREGGVYLWYFPFKEISVVFTLVEKGNKLGSVKVSLVEQMPRSLRARLKGIVRLVCMGRHEEVSKYWSL